MRWIPRTNGPSRSHRIGAARATARSCTGRRASKQKERSVRSSAMSSTLPRRSLKLPVCRSPHRQQRAAGADGGSQHAIYLRRCESGRSARDPVLRDVLQPRHLPQGLDRGDSPQHALGGDGKLPAFDDDVWELYDTNTDWSQSHDLSKEMPDKLHELQRLWLIEATRNNVLPMDDRRAERFNADVAGRPVLVRGDSQVLATAWARLNENGIINVKNKSHSVTAAARRSRGETGERSHLIARRDRRRLDVLRQRRKAGVSL